MASRGQQAVKGLTREAGRLSTATLRSITIDDPELLRAVRASCLLRHCGRLFASSEGSAETFGLSRPVDAITEFISHNWSTPRLKKFLVLALHFNYAAALLAALAASLAVLVLVAAGALPTFPYSESRELPVSGLTPYCAVVGTATMLLVLLCGHEVRSLLSDLGFKSALGPKVFFDKVCIHQTDADLKLRGIMSLAAQLRHSKSVTVVYTDCYLRRLWTVYELASALLLSPDCRLVVLPTFLPALVFIGMLLWLAIALVYELSHSRALRTVLECDEEEALTLPTVVAIGSTTVVLLGYSAVVRLWARARQRIQADVLQFSIRETVCAVESDRAVVKQNIACFMRDFGFVRQEASMDEVLDDFDSLVKSKIPVALRLSFGRTGIPYRFIVAMVFPAGLGYCFDLTATLLRAGRPWMHVAMVFVDVLAYSLLFLPSLMGICSLLVGVLPRSSRRTDVLLVLASALVGGGIMLMYARLYFNTITDGDSSPAPLMSRRGLGGWLLYLCLQCALTFLLYRKPGPEPGGGRAAAKCPSSASTESSESSSGSEVGHPRACT